MGKRGRTVYSINALRRLLGRHHSIGNSETARVITMGVVKRITGKRIKIREITNSNTSKKNE